MNWKIVLRAIAFAIAIFFLLHATRIINILDYKLLSRIAGGEDIIAELSQNIDLLNSVILYVGIAMLVGFFAIVYYKWYKTKGQFKLDNSPESRDFLKKFAKFIMPIQLYLTTWLVSLMVYLFATVFITAIISLAYTEGFFLTKTAFYVFFFVLFLDLSLEWTKPILWKLGREDLEKWVPKELRDEKEKK